jgi:2-polyprenyl-3-methyl-5-hydroxy-6-metoxy-1,4-benzoquinol methylase
MGTRQRPRDQSRDFRIKVRNPRRLREVVDATLPDYYLHDRVDLFDFLTRHSGRLDGCVLEVGCAAGNAAPHFRQLGAKYLEGLEPNELAASRAASTELYDVVRTCTFEQWHPHFTHYDCVVLPDVLEHMLDPTRALRRIRELLPASGKLVISVPNVRHLSVLVQLIMLGDWRYSDAGILDRTHVRFFTSKSLKRLLAETGFRLVAFERYGSNRLARTATALMPRAGEFLLTEMFVLAMPL